MLQNTWNNLGVGIIVFITSRDKHYYEEKEIEVGNPINCKVVVNHTVELTEEEKEEARQEAMAKLRDEQVAKMRKPTVKKATENKPQIEQPSLFDF